MPPRDRGLYFKIMTREDIKIKQKALRRYIRLLGYKSHVKDAKKAQRFLMIIHNYLWVEDLYYDQMLMQNKSIGKHLKLEEGITNVNNAIALFRTVYDPNHHVRSAIETLEDVSDIKYFFQSLSKQEQNDLYDTLIIL